MKTFEEALALSFQKVAISDEQGQADAVETVKQTSSRFREIAAQADDNEDVTMLCAAMVQAVASKDMPPMSAFFTAFMHGLIVGIEMEKAE